VLVSLDSLCGFELVLPDNVHLTARGEAHLALVAVRALQGLGVEAQERELQQALIPLRTGAKLRYACGAHALAQLRDWRRLAVEQASRRVA
jgi:hypothetical protein